MLDNAYAVILAGGRGERFWPLSTVAHPKQLLRLFGGKSLLERAVGYLRGIVPERNIVIVTSRELAPAVRREVPMVPHQNIIGEPVGRDTAAACAAGSAWVAARSHSAVFCVLTADHLIGQINIFRKTVRACLEHARTSERLVTIGIRPTHPSTAFGYIETGDCISKGDSVRFYEAKRFVEKPDLPTAKKYLNSGRFLWNSGMFFWSVETFWKALFTHCHHLYDMARRLEENAERGRLENALAAEYKKISKISIDYALMEKAANISVTPGEFPWDDLGSWPALGDHFPSDKEGNVHIGICETLASSGNIVVSREKLTALVGARDLIVVNTPQATLVCHKDHAQDVRNMVRMLSSRKRYRHLL